MIRILLLLALLALALLAERGIDRAESARRAGDPRVERLVAEGRLAGEKVAAITVESGGVELLYGRKEGRWRSREAFGALCDEDLVKDLLRGFVDARGVERSGSGLDEGSRASVRFHGPKVLDAADRDVLLAFDVLRTFPEGPRGRAFVRAAGSPRVLETDRDPLRPLASASETIPPLVDTLFLAGALAGEFQGFREIRIEPRDEEPFAIARDPSAPAEAGSAWILERGGRKEPFPGWRVGGFVGLWLRGRFEGFESPRRARELGVDPPAARVVLVPEGGVPIELLVSAVDPSNRAHVLSPRTEVVGTVPGELQPLLAPRPELFTDASRPNPWEAWLGRP